VTYVKEWNSKELLAKVSGHVLEGMDDACKFAKAAAWGYAPDRTGKLRGGIDYTIEVERADVVGKVGVVAGKDAPYYGYFVELGTKKMAAKPFLRPAVFDNAAEIVRRIIGGGL
jgi:HK97 gp10 family phage protein